jgi:uncharacterized membrane protein YedE/YeeE
VSEGTKRIVASLAAGLLFGLGLVISGMSDPAKVLNFLDIAGLWDPSLAFVMAGAVTVAFVGYRIVFGRGRPLFDATFHVSAVVKVDPSLMAGSAVFGLGWGLSGFCPGPAFTALPLLASGTLVFVPAMFAGMWAARVTPKLAPRGLA